MIGSISKIRPCAHSHYYKYAHAVDTNSLKHINSRYSDDHYDGVWEFSINNFVKPNGPLSVWQSGTEDGTFQSNKNIVTLKISAPNIVYCNGLCYGMSNLENCIFDEVDNNKVYQLTYMFGGCKKLKYISESFNPNPETMSPDGSWWIFRGGSNNLFKTNNNTFPYYEWLDKIHGACTGFITWDDSGPLGNSEIVSLDERYTFPNLTAMDMGDSSWSNGSAITIKKLPDNLSLNNATSISFEGALSYEFHAANPLEKCTSITLDGNNGLRHLYKDSDSFSWPAMKKVQAGLRGNNNNTMWCCSLSGESVIKLCEALPKWTDGKDKNTLSLMMHNDNYYNPIVNLALKRLDKDFITPIEQKGGTLPEEVTEDKGWRITACGIHNGWAPISLLDEYLQDPIIEEIDYYIELPENYQRCKWLKSKGTEKNYIDCGMPANNETGLMLIAKAASGDTNNGSFGNTYSGTGSLYCPSAGPERAWSGKWDNVYLPPYHPWYGGRTSVGKLNWLNDRQWSCTIGMDHSLDGTLPDLSGTSPKNIWLFGVNYNANTYYTGYVYRAKISQGTEIVRDFVPCLNPDGKPCMYDIINGVEYHNQGTGADFEYELYG